jgi:TonB family protein
MRLGDLSIPVEPSSALVTATGEVYSVREVARAASVPVREIAALVDTNRVASVLAGFIAEPEALRAIRLVRDASEEYRQREIFGTPARAERTGALPFAASTLLHLATVAAIALLTLGVRGAITEARVNREPVRLVFLAVPGPGGGGGGGGLKQPQPPSRAKLEGKSTLRSPVRTEPRRPKVEPKPEPKPEPPPPPEPLPRPVEKPRDVPVAQPAPPVPPVVAPVASVPAEERNQAGVPEAPPQAPPSQGPGVGGGTGTGQGTGMGEGKGSGVGPGEGGGTGGGPYRPGSGITPPGLLREVKPQYTEDARRLGVEGDVVLEIVVRADGTVGPVTVLQRLGSGLDERAVQAVRQWRFSPARRFGTPVDVLVEVAVEFKLR